MGKFEKAFTGILVANVVGFVIIWLTSYLTQSSNDWGAFTFSEFIIVPILMGIICAWFWRKLELSSGEKIVYNIYCSLIAILLSAIILREGVICLVIVSPLIWAFTYTGIAIGGKMFQKDDQRINVSIIGLLLAVFIADSLATHHYENKVSDTIVIEAPVDKVWKNVVAYDRIKEPAKFWLFKIGMPSPVQSTVDGYKLGAGRKCIFSNGYVFDEKMVVYKPNKELTFDITNQPKDPEIMGHIDILRGQFILKQNGDGSTTLTGNSWYRLHVFPVWYVHLRVMAQIKQLSERNSSVHVSY
jgi:hypothetical protein